MGTSFGSIALPKEFAEQAFRLCSEWEQNGFLYNFLLVKSSGPWCSIFDDSLEWGTVDLYVRKLSEQLSSTVLSVEYYDDESVRFRLWQNHCCIGQHIPCDGLMESRTVGDIKVFAKALKTKQEIMRQVFKSQNAEECLELIECLLQCPLWGIADFQDGVKLYEADSYTTDYLEDYLRKAASLRKKASLRRTACLEMADRHKTGDEYSITLKNKWEQTVLEASFKNTFIFTSRDRGQAVFVLEPAGGLVEKMKLSPEKRFNGTNSNRLCGTDDLFGFMTYDKGGNLGEGRFTVYENNQLLCSFPDICEKGIGGWYAYIPDRDHICMEWACYNVRNGSKEWSFSVPEDLKAQNFSMRSWREMPDGRILLQLENEKSLAFLSVDLDGASKFLFSLKRTGNYNFYYWDFAEDLLYLYQKSQGTGQPDRLHLFDLNFNKIADYVIENKFFSCRVVFDSKGEFLYGSDNKVLIRLERGSGIETVYDCCAGKYIEILDMLPDDILAVSSGMDLILLDTKNGMRCVMKHRLKGYMNRFWPSWYGKTLLITIKEGKLQREEQNIFLYEIQRMRRIM